MRVTVRSEIDFSAAIRKIESSGFWEFGAKEWERQIRPYVPRRTGHLMSNVEFKPKTITYKEPYSAYQYFGRVYVDPKFNAGGFTKDGATFRSRKNVKKAPSDRQLQYRHNMNPKATKEWDKKAISEKKDLLLISSMQAWIDRNL